MSNRPKKLSQLEKTELIIPKDNLDVSALTGLGSSLASVTPQQKHIIRKK